MKREPQKNARHNLLGWFIVSCFVSVACLPQTSGVLGVNQNAVQVGLSVDANSRLQNIVIAAAPNSVVRVCEPQTTAEACFTGQNILPMQDKGVRDNVKFYSIEDAAALSAIAAQFKGMELYVGTSAGASVDPSTVKSFSVAIEGTNPTNIAAAPLNLPVSAQAATNQPAATQPSVTQPSGAASSALANTVQANGEVSMPVVVAGRVTATHSIPKTDFDALFNSSLGTNGNPTCKSQNGVLAYDASNQLVCLPR